MVYLDRFRGFLDSFGKKKETPPLSNAPQSLQDGEWNISYASKTIEGESIESILVSIRREGGAHAWVYSIPLHNGNQPEFERATVVHRKPGMSQKTVDADQKEKEMLKYIVTGHLAKQKLNTAHTPETAQKENV
jgi:hypothetical protein